MHLQFLNLVQRDLSANGFEKFQEWGCVVFYEIDFLLKFADVFDRVTFDKTYYLFWGS